MTGFKVYFAHWVSHVHMIAIPALLPFLPEFFDVGYLELGFGATLFMLITLIFQVPFGFIVDTYGAKRLLGLALVTSALAFFSLALFPNIIWFMVIMAVLGLVNTVYHPADYSLLAQITPEAKLGRAFSYHTFSGNLGTAMTPGIMLAAAQFGGVPFAFLVAGLLSLVAAYVLDPLHKAVGRGRYYLFVHSVEVLQKVEPKGEDRAWQKQRRNLVTQIFIMTTFFTLVVASTRPIEQFGQIALIEGYGFSEENATLLVTVFLFALAFGVLIGGRVADKTDRHGMIAAGSYAVGTGLTLLIAVSTFSLNALLAIFIVAGLLIGMIAPSRDMMVKKIAPPGTEGRMFATVSTGFHIGGAVVPVVMGWFMDHGMPQWIFVSAAIGMAGVVFVALIQELLTASWRRANAAATSVSSDVQKDSQGIR